MAGRRPAFGGSTFSFMWTEPAVAAMRRMRQIGLNGFDVILAPWHCWPGELSGLARASLARALRDEDIRVESLYLPALDQNLASCVPEIRCPRGRPLHAAPGLSADLGGALVLVPGRASARLPPPVERSGGGWPTAWNSCSGARSVSTRRFTSRPILRRPSLRSTGSSAS